MNCSVRNIKRSLSADSKGHTLLELMIALALVGILATITVSGFQSQRAASARLQAQASLGALMLTLAQQAASERVVGGGVPKLSSSGLVLPEGGRQNDAYVYRLLPQPAGADADYWVVATPREGSSLAGNGALSLTASGLGCWHRGNDAPVSSECGEADEVW